MEDKIPTSIKKHLKNSYDNTGDEIGEYTGAILDFIDDNPKASLLDLYDEMRKLSPYHNMPKHEVLDQLYALNGILRNKGYKGLRHRGGVLTSSPEHEVNIFFDPQKDLNVKPIAEWYTEKQLKIMNRKPKKDGGLLVSIGVAPVSEKQLSKLKKSLKQRQAKREATEKYERAKDQVRKVKGKYVSEKKLAQQYNKFQDELDAIDTGFTKVDKDGNPVANVAAWRKAGKPKPLDPLDKDLRVFPKKRLIDTFKKGRKIVNRKRGGMIKKPRGWGAARYTKR